MVRTAPGAVRTLSTVPPPRRLRTNVLDTGTTNCTPKSEGLLIKYDFIHQIITSRHVTIEIAGS